MNRAALDVDRLCDECHKPMIGIMKTSDPAPPRRICAKCGGNIISPKKDDNDGS